MPIFYIMISPNFFRELRSMSGQPAECLKQYHRTREFQISTENLMLAERKILQRINKLISKKSKQYGWTSIDGITELFRSRGYCSSRSLIRYVSYFLNFSTLFFIYEYFYLSKGVRDLIIYLQKCTRFSSFTRKQSWSLSSY